MLSRICRIWNWIMRPKRLHWEERISRLKIVAMAERERGEG